MAAGIRLARWFFDEGRRVYEMLAGDAHDDAARAARRLDRTSRLRGERPGRDAAPARVSDGDTRDAGTRRLGVSGRWRVARPAARAGRGRPTRNFTLGAEARDWADDETAGHATYEADSSTSADRGTPHAGDPEATGDPD